MPPVFLQRHSFIELHTPRSCDHDDNVIQDLLPESCFAIAKEILPLSLENQHTFLCLFRYPGHLVFCNQGWFDTFF